MTEYRPEQHEHYRRAFEAQKSVNIYFLTCQDRSGKPIYAYVAASALLHEQFMRAIEKSVIPDFAVVVEKGYGLPPSDAVKEKMKAYYKFDHATAALALKDAGPLGE